MAVTKYGYSLPQVIPSNSELFGDLVRTATTDPFGVYSMASHHGFEALAISVSTKTLPFKLTNITAAMTAEMGPSYLLRLYVLHSSRRDALKQLLHVAPDAHTGRRRCAPEQQTSVMRAYAMASGHLIWEADVADNPDAIRGGLGSLLEHIECSVCQGNVSRRIDSVVEGWSLVAKTI